MPKYRVKSPIKHGGKLHAVNAEVEMSEKEAAPLLGKELDPVTETAKETDTEVSVDQSGDESAAEDNDTSDKGAGSKKSKKTK